LRLLEKAITQGEAISLRRNRFNKRRTPRTWSG